MMMMTAMMMMLYVCFDDDGDDDDSCAKPLFLSSLYNQKRSNITPRGSVWATAPSVSVENKFVLQTPNTENVDYIHGHETRRQVLYLNSGRLPPYLQLAPDDRVPGNMLLQPFPAPQSNHIARRSMRQS